MSARYIFDDNKKTILECGYYKLVNKRITTAFNLVKKYLPKANFIYHLDSLAGWSQHRWHGGDLHYFDLYYQYYYNSILAIVDGNNKDLENIFLEYNVLMNLMIKNRKLEYLLSNNHSSGFFYNTDFNDEWIQSLSPDSFYDVSNKILKCGWGDHKYAILSKTLDLPNHKICISLDLEMQKGEEINIELVDLQNKKHFYFVFDKIALLDKECLCFLDLSDRESSSEFLFKIFINKPNSQVRLLGLTIYD